MLKSSILVSFIVVLHIRGSFSYNIHDDSQELELLDLHATHSITNTEGRRVHHDQAFSLPLRKAAVATDRQVSFLQKLKMLQLNAYDMSLLDESEVPLHQQVLSEKRLATYYGDVSIGVCGNKPKCQFKVLMDTGSCEFWIPSLNCPKNTDPTRCSKHSVFDHSLSRTFEPFKQQSKMSIQYLSGKVEGFMGRDTVGLGQLQVTEQVFGMADTVDVPLLDEVVWDGIIGLAYPNEKLHKEGVVPLFDNIMEKKLLQNNVFSYYLGNNGGAVTFGGVDTRFFSADDKFRYAVVTEKGYWSIEIIDIELQVGNEAPRSTGVCKSKANGRCKAIVDTGTYLIYGPRDQVSDPNGLGQVQVDKCGNVAALPKITFVLYAGEGAKPARLTLLPHDYTLQFVVDKSASCTTPRLRQGGEASSCKSDCVMGIAPDNDSGWTLGQVFLRSYYTVFDRDQDRIGFVRSKSRLQDGQHVYA